MGRSPLVFVRGIMNAQRYVADTIEPHFLPHFPTLPNPVFQQDNARPHIARVTLACFEQADVILLTWPPRSPELFPIEHVWDIIGRRLGNLMRPPQTLEDLRHKIQVAWDEIPQEEIDNFINSMPRRA
jgi:hypothetical protein